MQAIGFQKVCLEIEKLIQGLIWGNTADHRSVSLVKWKEIRQPLRSGGLGFWHLKSFNQAFIMKLGFQLIHDEQKLWVQV
ncbi:hypothetical protein GQ457_13G009820 [Hibiscus cannabinus]